MPKPMTQELLDDIAEVVREQERKRCAEIALNFTVKPDRSIHPDVKWEEMSESAKMVAHTTAQQIAYAIMHQARIDA